MLTQDQLLFYKKNGYLKIENWFEDTEIDTLEKEILIFENFKAEPNVICEENDDIRSVFAPHFQNQLFDDLYKNRKIVVACEQLIEAKIYLYQYKLNLKKAFAGNFWEWHQDFPYWHLDDGTASPDMISVMLLLNDTHGYQGPLIVVPGSHTLGIVEMQRKTHFQDNDFQLKDSLSADLKYTVSNTLVKEYADKNGIVSLDGKKGTLLFFHPNIFHASNSNVSPYNRNTAIFTYNSIHNVPKNVDNPRPDYITLRNTQPIFT